MKELSKSVIRRQNDPRFFRRYFVGQGIDIGGLPDPLSLYKEFFPLVSEVEVWDWEQGDAQYMHGVESDTFDFVHSSHCLEHLKDPYEGLANWFRILKPGGHLVITVPEEDLYEQYKWPSSFNYDHKWTFTIFKLESWCEASINILDLLATLGKKADIRKISVEDSGFRYSLPRYDQTLTPVSESAIEIIVRKRLDSEILNMGRKPGDSQPENSLLPYFNQYRIDYEFLKRQAKDDPPFKNINRI